jgi:hypothetical protein
MTKNILIFSDGTGQAGGLTPDERSTKTTKPERDHGAGGSNPRHLFNGVNHNGTTTNWRQGHDRCRTPAPAPLNSVLDFAAALHRATGGFSNPGGSPDDAAHPAAPSPAATGGAG